MSDDPDLSPLSPEEEKMLREVIERGMQRYRGIAPADLQALMREVGEEGLRTHPLLRKLLRRAAAQPAPDRSGDLPKGKPGPSNGEAGGKEGA